ncbi:MAG: 3-isopropylmalate dehydratase [Firmicutes bacterium]|nr:3-isopropylmalate dehydratase [Bacillota bacterium]
MSVVTGKVWKYGDDVNTDVIFPGKYTYTIKERADMAKVACEDLDADFNKNAKAGDIIVGGKNWGCGSSREQAVTCIKERGIAAIIARSFARIYYRNCFNEGLAIIICPEAVDAIEAGEEVTIDFDNFVITTAKGQKIPFPHYPEFVQGLIADGGLIPHVKKELGLA